MKKIRVLLVEDDPALRMVVSETLELEQFEVVSAVDGVEGLHKYNEEAFDVVVADIMMPRVDGLEMVRRMRQRAQRVPILFLTAKSTVESVVEGFEAGCDDYLRKPFSMRELMVRIKALHLRSSGAGNTAALSQPNLIKIGAYRLDPLSQYLSYGSETVQLSSKESEILRLLALSLNQVVPARTIMNRLWHDDSHYVANSLQVFITRLRQRLGKDPTVRIINARGEGYKLTVDVPV